MLESLDAIIATAAVVLGLSLIVQAVQQIMKQWLDLKSNYMRLQLLGMFDSASATQEFKSPGLTRVTQLAEKADNNAKNVVAEIEKKVKSFGYKDLELLEHLDAAKLKQIIAGIKWSELPGVTSTLNELQDEIDVWFDIAKTAYQDLYERRMKLWSFILSAIVVIALDANIFRVYHEFTVNTPLRNAAVAWAEKNVPGHIQSTITVKDSAKTVVVINDSLRAANIRAQVDTVKAILGSDGFRVLGWKAGSFQLICTQGWFWSWVSGFIGWIGMALLVSLGAPFWYDFLKTVMGVKEMLKGSSPKPGDKSKA